MTPLTFYVDPAWRREHAIHTPFLNPWWGNPLTDSSLLTKQAYDSYQFDTSCYSITDDIEKAEMVLAPYPHVWFVRHDKAFLDACVAKAEEYNLPILIDGSGDHEYPIPPHALVLRYTGYRFKQDPRVISIPLFTDDLLERCRDGKLTVRKKSDQQPVVGFAGWASLSPLQFLKTVLKELSIRLYSLIDHRYSACIKGVLWRMKAIKILTASPLVLFKSKARASFSGSAKTAQGSLETLREEMVETILESDYALDVKGDANNSARLFEILSLGRIPVIIDTERILPFRDKIDYAACALIIDFRDIAHVAERISEFHTQVSPERFEEMQRRARDIYTKYFRIDAVMPHIIEAIRSRMVLH